MKRSSLSRHQIAGEISHLLDRDVSKDMLDKYVSESADGHRLPADVLAALVVVLKCGRPLEVIADAVDYAAIPLPTECVGEPRANWNMGVLRVARQLGAVAHAVEQALEDGTLTASEAARCTEKVSDLIRSAVAFRQSLEVVQ